MTAPKLIEDAIEAAAFASRMPEPGGTVAEEDGVAVFRAADGSLVGFMNMADYRELRSKSE